MRCRDRCLLVVGLVLLVGWRAPAQDVKKPGSPKQAARLDQFGDPLPEGALARLGSTRFHHQDGLIAVTFSPDGKTILAGGMEDKGLSLRFWETATGKELSRIHVEGSDLTTLAFTPDAKAVLVGRRTEVELYDRATGKLLCSFGDKKQCYAFAISPDGTMLATHAQATDYLQQQQQTTHVGEHFVPRQLHFGEVTSVAFAVAAGGSQRLAQASARNDRAGRAGSSANAASPGSPGAAAQTRSLTVAARYDNVAACGLYETRQFHNKPRQRNNEPRP